LKSQLEHVLPKDIETRSFEIIASLLGERKFPEGQADIIMRAIHTSADFDYADSLIFSEGAIEAGLAALKAGATIITDTQMALSGINKPALAALGAKAVCYIAAPEVAAMAGEAGTTRAQAAVDKSVGIEGPKIYAVGNAPTALVRLYEHITEDGFRPALIIGVPVGFVNVEAAKELILETDVPHIVARGRKGGSNIAAAIVNALLYKLARPQ